MANVFACIDSTHALSFISVESFSFALVVARGLAAIHNEGKEAPLQSFMGLTKEMR